MNAIDLSIIAIYFVVVLTFGFWYRKRAAANLGSYFLGNNRLHWSLLSMSGAVSNFDITGTMWMVAIVYTVGMKSWWHFQMAGFILPAICMVTIGKWVRRSQVITGAEWMVTRFGNGTQGRVARYAYAFLAIVTCVSFIGYAFQGIGKFAQVYIPIAGVAETFPALGDFVTTYEAQILALIIFSLTTLYIILGGLVGVVLTDGIQTVILTVAALLIGGIAYTQLTPDAIRAAIPEDFSSLAPVWRMDRFANSSNPKESIYYLFGAMTIVWVLKGVLLSAGGPQQLYDLQRYLAARNPRDAAKIGAAWPFFQSVRWLLVMGITLLAMTGFEGVDDPERVMPLVLQEYLPIGLRGLVIAGLLAAFMSTFSSTVNSGASYVVRDLWQPLFRPNADERSLIPASYVATVGVVVLGIIIGFNADSISRIWNWIMMALGSSVVMPMFLRWYWWRMNGWGYAAGVLVGIALSIGVLFFDNPPEYVTFPILTGGSLLACIVASLMTRPVESEVVEQFYAKVRPFGLWGPVKRAVPALETPARRRCESPALSILNIALAILMLSGLYLFPCYLVGHWHTQAFAWIGVIVACWCVLYFTWYRNLPSEDEIDEAPTG
jgi:SSS family solute:Na+ symporter